MSRASLLALCGLLVSPSVLADPAPGATDCSAHEAAAPATQAATAKVTTYGATLSTAERLTLTDIISRADKLGDKTVMVEGHVRKACTRKGCWMELAESAEPNAQGLRVTFKDYGFFVPLDSAGSRARIQGVVKVKVVSKGDVAHLESEGAKFTSKAPDGTAREVQFVATGVEMWRS
jgi:hypothetical protein